ncbi:hypothetical protein SRHO_G00257140 [Serrasalmus rhombeus]
MLNLSQPAPFLQSAGEPLVPFKSWIRVFDNYVLAVGEELSDARKRALLIHCLGAEGQRIFYTLTVADDKYATALTAIQDFFVPKVNVVAERYRFRQRSQHTGESTDQYIAALRELAATCEFGAMEEEMIRDQLVEKTSSTRIRERLLLEVPLDLKKAMTIARQIETAVAEAKVMMGAADGAVHAVQHSGKLRRGHGKGTPLQRPRGVWNNAQGITCYRCGSGQHVATSPGCPAKDAMCRSCNKKGHFAKVCRGTKKVSEVTAPEVTVLHIERNARDTGKITCTVQIQVGNAQSQKLELMVDTGSAVSILPMAVYKQFFSHAALSAPKLSLVSFGGNAVSVNGCLKADITFRDRSVMAELYIVQRGSAVLGRDLFSALQLQILNGIVSSAACNRSVSAVVATQQNVLGCAKGFLHQVKTRSDVQPVQQKLRRLPFSVREAVSAELRKLVEQDVIEPIEASEWVSPIVVTRKKNGGVRLCVDLREPNKGVVVDSFPLPHMEEMFTELRGATLFSTLDLQSAYHQVMLHEDSRNLTAFITHDGLFRFKRIPYGLASAPSCFQRMMSIILKGQVGVQCYLDDIIVSGATAEDHDKNLESVLQRINKAGLRLNFEKCRFRQPELSFLGHTVSAKGLQPDASHVAAVSQAPPPTDTVSLQSFLGLTSWYAKFIPNYAAIVEPLRALLRGAVSIVWTEEAQQSFERVKELIVNSPALALFNPELPTIVTTDASDYGVGAVLTQLHPESTEKTVAFASRTLTQAERKYSTIEKEALACVWATEKWRTYLWGRHFTLRMDHSPLTTLLSSKGHGRAGMRIARWSARLMTYTYDIQYKPGRENVTADCLSRLPLRCEEPCLDNDEEVVALTSILTAVAGEEFKAAWASCPVQTKLRELLTSRWPKSAKALDPALQPYFKLQNELSLQDDCVVRGTNRLVVPGSLQSRLISLAHDTHQGIVRTKKRLRELYWWPGMDTQVEAFIKACVTCQLHDKSAVTHPTPMQPVPYPTSAWEKLAIDIMGPFDNWYPTMDHSSLLVERFNHSLKDCLQTASLEHKDWKEFTKDFLQAYRATPHATTQCSPAEMLHGRLMRTKLHVSGLKVPVPCTTSSPLEVSERVKTQQAKSKAYTDKRRGARHVSFQSGSYVRVKKPGILPKSQSKFGKPLKVMARRGPYSYELSDGRCWNASHLAPALPQMETQDSSDLSLMNFDITHPTQNTQVRASSRSRKAPVWAKDYRM